MQGNIISLILFIIQLSFVFNNMSITAISREGKNAILMKCIPINYYTQFKMKVVLGIIINMFSTAIVIAIFYGITKISLLYLFVVIVLATLLNISENYLMLILDLKRPNLDWSAESEAIKQSKNSFLKMLIEILLAVYFLRNFTTRVVAANLTIRSYFIILIFATIVLDLYAYNKQDELFEKIN